LVGALSLVVLSLLDALHLMVNTSMGGVAVLSFRGIQTTGFFSWCSYPTARRESFPRGGHSFDRMDFANPTFEQIARH
jgi:hypothetical protein